MDKNMTVKDTNGNKLGVVEFNGRTFEAFNTADLSIGEFSTASDAAYALTPEYTVLAWGSKGLRVA